MNIYYVISSECLLVALGCWLALVVAGYGVGSGQAGNPSPEARRPRQRPAEAGRSPYLPAAVQAVRASRTLTCVFVFRTERRALAVPRPRRLYFLFTVRDEAVAPSCALPGCPPPPPPTLPPPVRPPIALVIMLLFVVPKDVPSAAGPRKREHPDDVDPRALSTPSTARLT